MPVRADMDLSWMNSDPVFNAAITTKGWVTIHGHPVLLGATDKGSSGGGGGGGGGGGLSHDTAKAQAIAAYQNYYVHGQGKLADYNRELKRIAGESGLKKADLENEGMKHYQEQQKKLTATATVPSTAPPPNVGMSTVTSGSRTYVATSDVAAAQAWGAKGYGEYTGQLSLDERKAFIGYSKGGDQPINDYLRYGKMVPADKAKNAHQQPDVVQERIAHLDNALARSKVPEDVQVHRGFTHPELIAKMERGDPLTGTDFQDKGYVSTSVAAGGKFSGQPIVARINVRKGAKGAYMGPSISKFPEETEMLLPRGSNFKITGYARVRTSWGSQWELYMDYDGA